MSRRRELELAAAYDTARPRLVRVAYAILGSQADAQDVACDCWLRLVNTDAREPILDVEAWATVAVARMALDVLRSARMRRETYVGSWLPEPHVEPHVEPLGVGPCAGDPADRVTLDESVSYALLVMLETLSPAERTAWVLHDLFRLPFAEVAAAVGRSAAAVRQLAARARCHIAAGAPRLDVDQTRHQAVVGAFTRATNTGDLAGLLAILDPQVFLTSDGGGHVTAARRPIHGAERVARFLLGIASKAPKDQRLLPVTVNGDLGLALLDAEQPRGHRRDHRPGRPHPTSRPGTRPRQTRAAPTEHRNPNPWRGEYRSTNNPRIVPSHSAIRMRAARTLARDKEDQQP